MTRHIFIGDIQGCREELELLLERLRFDPAADELHPVGDLVNRGPDSAGTLRLLKKLGAGGVLGNHDLHLLGVWRGTRKLRKRDTAGDVLEAEDGKKLLRWLAGRPLVRELPGVLVIHAGIHPDWKDPVKRLAGKDIFHPDEEVAFATRVRYCDEAGCRPTDPSDPPGPPYKPWYVFRPKSKRTVVFGHWARRGLVEKAGLRGLDTGCVWGGELTAWIAEEDRFVSVEARRAYQSL